MESQAENMDLSPSVARRGQSHFRGETGVFCRRSQSRRENRDSPPVNGYGSILLPAHLPAEVARREAHRLLEPPREMKRVVEAQFVGDLVQRIV